MPAPRTNRSTGVMVMVVAILLGIGACASNRPEQPAGAGRAAPAEANFDDYAPHAPAGVSADLLQLEDSLEDYEQQLAQNESRLRAMGVRIASADPADKREAEAVARDDRFAPPPPMGDAPERARDGKAESKSKAPAKKTASSTPRPTAPATPGRAQGGAAGKPAEPKPVAAEEQDDEVGRGRCAELCDLAQATCELEAKICDLAARHTDDPRYGEVCRRADDDCRVASEACNLCSP